MSILIKGMEMPKEGFVEILVRDDGTVQQTGQSYRIGGTDYYTPYVGEMPAIFKAVPVPPHGRLIDRDPLIAEYDKALNWLQEHIDELSCEEYSMQFAAVMMAKTVLINAPIVEEKQ